MRSFFDCYCHGIWFIINDWVKWILFLGFFAFFYTFLLSRVDRSAVKHAQNVQTWTCDFMSMKKLVHTPRMPVLLSKYRMNPLSQSYENSIAYMFYEHKIALFMFQQAEQPNQPNTIQLGCSSTSHNLTNFCAHYHSVRPNVVVPIHSPSWEDWLLWQTKPL